MTTLDDSGDLEADTSGVRKSLNLSGSLIALDKDRYVWLGNNVDDPKDDTAYVKFSNAGFATYLKLSNEAADALLQLLQGRRRQHFDTLVTQVSEWVLATNQDGSMSLTYESVGDAQEAAEAAKAT